jgi:hypothetical protein
MNGLPEIHLSLSIHMKVYMSFIVWISVRKKCFFWMFTSHYLNVEKFEIRFFYTISGSGIL